MANPKKTPLGNNFRIQQNIPQSKNCPFCSELVGFAESVCPKCLHILDRNLVRQRAEKDEILNEFIKGLEVFKQSNPDFFELLRNVGRETIKKEVFA